MLNNADNPHRDSLGSPERFGYSWARFNELTPEQEEQFRRWTAHLDPAADWKGKSFLDAGCGTGRNSYWPMTYGAAKCVAVDLDKNSLAAARRNLEPFPDAEVLECSIYDLPFEDEFDIVFSIGVIHHLGDPKTAIARMVGAAKPGSRVLIWVYGYENMRFYVHVLNPLRKLLFSRLPLSWVRALAYIPTSCLWLMLRAGITPIEYFRLLRGFPFKHLLSIVFDQMLPKIAHYWTEAESRNLLLDAGLADVRTEWVNEMSWSVIGTKKS